MKEYVPRCGHCIATGRFESAKILFLLYLLYFKGRLIITIHFCRSEGLYTR
jgi:hypothetical protein